MLFLSAGHGSGDGKVCKQLTKGSCDLGFGGRDVAELAAELASTERQFRRSMLLAEQRKAEQVELEAQVQDLRVLVSKLVAEEPSLRASVNEHYRGKIDPGLLRSLPREGGKQPVRLAEENVRLTAENRQLKWDLEELRNEHGTLRGDHSHLMKELADVEKERRRLALVSEQAKADLDQQHEAARRKFHGFRSALRSVSARDVTEKTSPKRSGVHVLPDHSACPSPQYSNDHATPRLKRNSRNAVSASPRVSSDFLAACDHRVGLPRYAVAGRRDSCQNMQTNMLATLLERQAALQQQVLSEVTECRRELAGKSEEQKQMLSERSMHAYADRSTEGHAIASPDKFINAVKFEDMDSPGCLKSPGADSVGLPEYSSILDSASDRRARQPRRSTWTKTRLHPSPSPDRHTGQELPPMPKHHPLVEEDEVLEWMQPEADQACEMSALNSAPTRLPTTDDLDFPSGSDLPCFEEQLEPPGQSAWQGPVCVDEKLGNTEESDPEIARFGEDSSPTTPTPLTTPAKRRLGRRTGNGSDIMDELRSSAGTPRRNDLFGTVFQPAGISRPPSGPSRGTSQHRRHSAPRERNFASMGTTRLRRTASNEALGHYWKAPALADRSIRNTMDSIDFGSLKNMFSKSSKSDCLITGPNAIAQNPASAATSFEEPSKASSKRVTGFFVLDTNQEGRPCVRKRWPASLEGGCLEDTVVKNRFCPEPLVFGHPDPAGCGREPFVFSLLETTLGPDGDPSGVVFGCVCSEDPATSPDPIIGNNQAPAKRKLVRKYLSSWWSPEAPLAQESVDASATGVLCLMTRLPLFAFWFDVLALIRQNVDKAEEILDYVDRRLLETAAIEDGFDCSDFAALGNILKIVLPRPLLCSWDAVVGTNEIAPLGNVSRTSARWQAAWALTVLLSRWDGLVGETLATLLAAMLLEQKILLFADVPRASAMALALRSLLWPFRWLHLFLSAPPPTCLLSVPLLDSPFPVLLVLSEFPDEWGYKTENALPPEVVTGVLRHDHVMISPAFAIPGGGDASAARLPAGRHEALIKYMMGVRQKLRKGETDFGDAVAMVQNAVEVEVGVLATTIREFVDDRAKDLEPGDGEKLYERSIDQKTFNAWIKERVTDESGCRQQSIAFYTTFFQTQLCFDYISEEIAMRSA